MNILSQPHTDAVVWVADQGETESYHLQRSEQPDSVGFSRTGRTTRRPARTTSHWSSQRDVVSRATVITGVTSGLFI